MEIKDLQQKEDKIAEDWTDELTNILKENTQESITGEDIRNKTVEQVMEITEKHARDLIKLGDKWVSQKLDVK